MHFGQALGSAPSLCRASQVEPEWPNRCQEKNKLKKINSQMFMHFTYTVPHGPLLGQQETTSECFIGFMKWVSKPLVREMLHNNTIAFLKPVLYLSTSNLNIRKSILMSWNYPYYHQNTSTFYLEILKCVSWGPFWEDLCMLDCSNNFTEVKRKVFNHHLSLWKWDQPH